MYCRQCGKKVGVKAKFCPDCGTKISVEAEEVTSSSNVEYSSPVGQTDTKKIYKILSYLGILFIVGMITPEKEDKSVRFHAGQGMILFISEVILSVVNAIVTSLVFVPLFRREVNLWGFVRGYETSAIGHIVISLCSMAVWAFLIYMIARGIMNVMKNEDKELPIIGKFAFYK